MYRRFGFFGGNLRLDPRRAEGIVGEDSRTKNPNLVHIFFNFISLHPQISQHTILHLRNIFHTLLNRWDLLPIYRGSHEIPYKLSSQGITVHKSPRGYTFTNPLKMAIYDKKICPEIYPSSRSIFEITQGQREISKISRGSRANLKN